MSLPDIPLSREAENLIRRLKSRIRNCITEAHRVPVAALLWGPGVGASSPLADLRSELRQELRSSGHAAFYSEELCDATSRDSVRLQQLAQAQEFDVVISTPCTPGSIGEIHDFIADRRVNARTLVFLNRDYVTGYSAQSIAAVSTILSCRVEYYPNEKDTSIIRTVTLEEVQRIREMKYILAGRY